MGDETQFSIYLSFLWMGGWINGWMGWVNECINGWMDAPYLDYCSVVWDDISEELTEKLQILQNRVFLSYPILWIGGQVDGWEDGWMNGRTDGWMDGLGGWLDRWTD